MKITIHGHVPSKKNSKRLVYAGHRPVLISSKAHEAWHTLASYELKPQIASRMAVGALPFVKPVTVSITIFSKDARDNDLTNKSESVLDLLVDNFVLSDDNWRVVREVNLTYGGVDRADPRAEIDIKPNHENNKIADNERQSTRPRVLPPHA